MIAPSAARKLWNFLFVAGKRAPGLVRLSGPGLVKGWDVQNPQGMSGGTTVRKGDPIKKFSATFDLTDETDRFSDNDFENWDAFQKMLLASIPPAIPIGLGAGGPTVNAQGKPFPLDISHPDLARIGITAATIESIGMLEPDGTGGGKITVNFLEYRPPRPIGAVKLTKTAGDAKLEAQMKTIEALQTEWKAL